MQICTCFPFNSKAHTHTHTNDSCEKAAVKKASDHSVVDIYYAQVLQFTGFMSTDN